MLFLRSQMYVLLTFINNILRKSLVLIKDSQKTLFDTSSSHLSVSADPSICFIG